MISRNEYRGCVKANVLKEDWETELAQTKTLVKEQKEQNKYRSQKYGIVHADIII